MIFEVGIRLMWAILIRFSLKRSEIGMFTGLFLVQVTLSINDSDNGAACVLTISMQIRQLFSLSLLLADC